MVAASADGDDNNNNNNNKIIQTFVRHTLSTSELNLNLMDYLMLTGESTFCVLADKLSLKVKNIVTKGVYDVVHTNWLQRCIDQQKLLKW